MATPGKTDIHQAAPVGGPEDGGGGADRGDYGHLHQHRQPALKESLMAQPTHSC
jgi:hypothetical protein